jgi:DNA polymerase III subunit epsilon
LNRPPAEPLDSLAARLEATGDYRVLRRFNPPSRYHAPDGSPTATALVVDVETTGLDPARERVIEFSGIPFTYARESGRIFDVGEAVTFLENPGRPIPAEVTQLTGITDDMVAGKRIDETAVAALVEGAGLVIAHNAGFDRPFLERRLPIFRDKAWACSQREIPWRLLGVSSAALEFLLLKRCGLFFDGHRADTDCRALIHLLAEPLDGGELPLQLLLSSARRRSYRVWAVDARIEFKDALKVRRYSWNNGSDGRPKAWYKEMSEEDYEKEKAWLAETIYAGGTGWRAEALTAVTRYSAFTPPAG